MGPFNRSGSIEAMWVLNADGKVLYSSSGQEKGEALTDPKLISSLRRGDTTINSNREGKSIYYDVLVPLQMPAGVPVGTVAIGEAEIVHER
jgi:hypothetical protein